MYVFFFLNVLLHRTNSSVQQLFNSVCSCQCAKMLACLLINAGLPTRGTCLSDIWFIFMHNQSWAHTWIHFTKKHAACRSYNNGVVCEIKSVRHTADALELATLVNVT